MQLRHTYLSVYGPEVLKLFSGAFFTSVFIFIILWYGAGQPIPHIPGHSFLELFGERIKTDLALAALPLVVSVAVIALALFSHANLFCWHVGHHPGLTFAETIFVLLGVWVFAGIAMSVSFGVQEGHTQLRGLVAISSLIGAFIFLLLCTSTRRLR